MQRRALPGGGDRIRKWQAKRSGALRATFCEGLQGMSGQNWLPAGAGRMPRTNCSKLSHELACDPRAFTLKTGRSARGCLSDGYQRPPASRMTRRSSDNPMTAMPFAQIARRLAARGGIRISESGRFHSSRIAGEHESGWPKAWGDWKACVCILDSASCHFCDLPGASAHSVRLYP